ncbi:MAG: hypothetical protein BGO70_10775 [Bacteroidetes bacterium 43-93]|nr:hypothetical protein [Bacteroidota bacterium]OJW95599.1 MAG: hypothetical protein BGO70_10775 [Bacteroidetes bacterium 43-93]
MRKYCLTYDVKDSENIDSTSLKKTIVELLHQNGAIITAFKNPVASTIIFVDKEDSMRISYWDGIINQTFGNDIFYYLCVVAKRTDNTFVDKDHGDPKMEANFQALIKDLVKR